MNQKSAMKQRESLTEVKILYFKLLLMNRPFIPSTFVFFFFFKLNNDVKRDLSLSEENDDEHNEDEGTRDEGKLRDKILLFKSLKESNKLRFLISFSLTQKPYVNIRASVFHFTLCRVKVWNF